MMTTTVRREVTRIASPPIGGGLTDAHHNRPLISPGDWAFTDPFLVLMEDWFPEGVFDRHPHRGFETVTYVIEGRIEHYDNRGHKGIIAAGDAQWLTAGRGLIHNEVPMGGRLAHTLQLWVNLPAKDKLIESHYQDLLAVSTPTRREPGVEVKVFSGASGSTRATTTNHAPVTMLEFSLDPGMSVDLDLPAGYNGFVLTMEGEAGIGTARTTLKAGQLAWLTRNEEASSVLVRGGDVPTKGLLIAGSPLQEPIAAQGPFVMNTDAQIRDAILEYRAQGDAFGL